MNPNSKYYVPPLHVSRAWIKQDPRRKLNTVQKTQIQRRRWDGESPKALAEEYGVSVDTIYRLPKWDGVL